MPINEKEINNYLFDQLEIIDRLEEVAETGDIEAVKKTLAKERKFIERKLYQEPFLSNK